MAGKSLRNTDVMACFGGWEFVTPSPGTDLAGAVFVANRLSQSVERRPSNCQPTAAA